MLNVYVQRRKCQILAHELLILINSSSRPVAYSFKKRHTKNRSIFGIEMNSLCDQRQILAKFNCSLDSLFFILTFVVCSSFFYLFTN